MEEFSPEWFDYSSKMWMMNKKRVGQGYEYKCKKEKCKNKCYLTSEWCKWHHPQMYRPQIQSTLRRSERIAAQEK